MSNQATIRQTATDGGGGFKSLVGPLVVICTTLIMLIWSWNTWTDPLVDFGTQLYVPWQLTQGKVLYRDIAYYNGPLSQYLNAMCFSIAGVSLRTIEMANLVFVALAIFLIYRLARRASGTVAAVSAAVGFVIFFAFNQTVGIANFNWVTPYTNEVTHGVVLGLIAIVCIGRYQRTARRRWLVAAGIALGLTFLTKAEPFAATLAATCAQLCGALWMARAKGRQWGRACAIFFGIGLAVPILAIALLAIKMPVGTAALGVAGSWRWVFDSRVAMLPFYRRVQGMDDRLGNIVLMGWWVLGYAIVLLPAIVIARRTPGAWGRLVASIVFLAILGGLFFWSDNIDWSSITRPLPIFMLVMMVFAVRRIVLRREAEIDGDSLRLALIVFADVMLIKVALNARLAHYGFVLSAGATLVMLSFVMEELPAWVERAGGSGGVVRAAGLAGALAAAMMMVRVDDHFFTAKQWWIGEGGDRFRIDVEGLEVQSMAELIDRTLPAGGTLAVFPQGLMLNYLTRRESPTPFINFMPPEVLAAGEQEILSVLMSHPPDGMVINSSSVRQDGFTLDSDYSYGGATLSWIEKNYVRTAMVRLPPPYPTSLHLVLMRPRTIRMTR